jgi:hypothetical protein
MEDDAPHALPPEKVACPCCGYATLDDRGRRHVCPVCYWEDDGSDNHCLDAESGWNNRTLRQARVSFLRIGVCDERGARYVRPATADENQLRRFGDNGEELAGTRLDS